MARTPSKMIELGKSAPDFKLLDTTDNKFKSSNDLFKNKGVLIMFICNHCPFVIHVLDEIIKISNEYKNDIRENYIMRIIAKGYSKKEIIEMSKFFKNRY